VPVHGDLVLRIPGEARLPDFAKVDGLQECLELFGLPTT
jgi:hypothetical protein